ncbi:hypothetical protein AVEN_99756-1 [Araneus ventricosus]|uniref:Uncharacterized protein n=1 Tax=Araneus ventricosus TaxID=182803 RepID=A0A4Y2DJ96_ARAVE|nr:hypothetical protein AVEN_99756-1 [Araneus ventricosus]
MATCQVFLQWCEEMKITWCDIRVLGRVFQRLCSRRARHFCTPVFVKESRVSTPFFMALRSLRKLPLVDDEIQLAFVFFKRKPYYTSHFNGRPCTVHAAIF